MILFVTSGFDRGRIIPLTEGETLIIGRGDSAHTLLTDPGVSRIHCELRVEGGRYVLADRGGEGGTTVNGTPIQEHELRPNDLIRVGNTELLLMVDDLHRQAKTAVVPLKQDENGPKPFESVNTPPLELDSLRQQGDTVVPPLTQNVARPEPHKTTEAPQSSFRRWLVVAVAGAILIGFAAWPRKQALTIVGKQALTIVGTASSGYFIEPLKEYLDESGSALELTFEEDPDPFSRAKKIADGTADLSLDTLDEMLRSKTQGKIVALTDHTTGSYALIVNTQKYPRLNSINELAKEAEDARSEKTPLGIAYRKGSVSEYFAHLFDSTFQNFILADLTHHDVSSPDDALELLENGDVAAAIVREPFVFKAKEQGFTVFSTDFAAVPIVDALIASDDLLETKGDSLRAFVEAYYQHIDRYKEQQYKLQSDIAAEMKLTREEAVATVNGLSLITAVEAQKWMKDRTLEEWIQDVSEVLLVYRELEAIPANIDNYYSPDFLDKAATTTRELSDSLKETKPVVSANLLGAGLPTDVGDISKTQNRSVTASLSPVRSSRHLLASVDFDTDSQALSDSAKETLSDIPWHWYRERVVFVNIVGHASCVDLDSQDRQSLSEQRQLLSEQRASEIAEYLKHELGVTLHIDTKGVGDLQLRPDVAGEDTRNQRADVELVEYGPGQTPSGSLHVLAIGIDYDGDRSLHYAAADAEAIKDVFERKKGNLFDEVHCDLITNTKATRKTILAKAEAFANRVTQFDTAVIFYAGHGILSEFDQSFYFLPFDGNPEADKLRPTAIGSHELSNILQGMRARHIVVIIDACHSGRAVQGLRPRAVHEDPINPVVHQLARGNGKEEGDGGVVIMAAALDSEKAKEGDEYQHGYFTMALLEGLEGKGYDGAIVDLNKDGRIDSRELDHYVSDRVTNMPGHSQHPITGAKFGTGTKFGKQDFPLSMP